MTQTIYPQTPMTDEFSLAELLKRAGHDDNALHEDVMRWTHGEVHGIGKTALMSSESAAELEIEHEAELIAEYELGRSGGIYDTANRAIAQIEKMRMAGADPDEILDFVLGDLISQRDSA